MKKALNVNAISEHSGYDIFGIDEEIDGDEGTWLGWVLVNVGLEGI